MKGIALVVTVAALTCAAVQGASAQSLPSRVGSAGASAHFSYAARPGICGDGRNYISLGNGNMVGTFTSYTDSTQCKAGPVRVTVDQAGGTVISVKTYVGSPIANADGTDIGTVSPSEAADYLLSVAARAEGRVGREAIFAALLADGVDVSDRLLQIGRDPARPLETRRAALSGLTRSGTRHTDRIGAALVQIATNEQDLQGVRSQALAVLSRLEHGGGIAPLIQVASGNLSVWTGREAISVLSRSGDPRARQFLRAVIQRADAPDELLATAIRGFGRDYVTAQDVAILRDVYPRFTGERSREAVLSTLSELGGSANVGWLASIVRDEKSSSEQKRRALQYLSHAGATSASMVTLYDATQDVQVRSSLIDLYARFGDKAATDRLVAIARSEPNLTLRRRAISSLSRNTDPGVRQVLQELVER